MKALPLERLLLETDSPSLAAAGPKALTASCRSPASRQRPASLILQARNEPGLIRAAAEKMAELKGVTLEEVTCW